MITTHPARTQRNTHRTKNQILNYTTRQTPSCDSAPARVFSGLTRESWTAPPATTARVDTTMAGVATPAPQGAHRSPCRLPT